MRIVVTGATGFIGRALCERLTLEGHEVIALARSSTPDRSVDASRIEAWDLLAGPPPPESLAGADAVIHLAGAPVSGRWTAARKSAIRESRVLGTRHLVQGLHGMDVLPRALLSASAIGWYGEGEDRELTEDAPAGSDFLARVTHDWETEAREAETLGIRVVSLRTGIVLGTGGGALRSMLPLFRAGLGGALGSGRQWWSWIHLDDEIGLILHALDQEELSGPMNLVSPEPARQRTVARALGRALRRPAFLPAPAVAIRVALGGFSSEILTSKRVVPDVASRTGYSFEFTDVQVALDDLLL